VRASFNRQGSLPPCLFTTLLINVRGDFCLVVGFAIGANRLTEVFYSFQLLLTPKIALSRARSCPGLLCHRLNECWGVSPEEAIRSHRQEAGPTAITAENKSPVGRTCPQTVGPLLMGCFVIDEIRKPRPVNDFADDSDGGDQFSLSPTDVTHHQDAAGQFLLDFESGPCFTGGNLEASSYRSLT
jgi:hypothetical protein